MMLLIAILIVLLVGSYLLSDRNVFCPGVLTSAVWLIMVGGYACFSGELCPLSGQVLAAAGLWCVLLVGSSLLVQSIASAGHERQSSDSIRRVYLLISVCCIPLLLLFVSNALRHGTTGNWALDLRLAALGKDVQNGDVYTPFYYIIWVITYLLYLMKVDRTSWKVTVALGLMVLGFGVATMSKTLILNFFIMTMYILYIRHIVRLRHIMIGLLVVVVGLVGMQVSRHDIHLSGQSLFKMVDQYVFMNLAAFDTLIPNSSEHFGEHVFRLYYAVTNRLGLGDVEAISPILPWVTDPVVTNTYTTLYPFFLDFGYSGIVIFAVLLGSGIGWLFRRSQSGDPVYMVLYTYFMVMLVTQYNGDAFFTNLAGNIKFMILAILPFIISRLKNLYQQA